MKKYFLLLTRALAMGGVIVCSIWARAKEQPKKDILMWISLSCFIVLTIVIMIDFIKPELFKERPRLPE
jgi:predicted membrane channel-forming protein YqfA (hemolysin III family)